MRIALVWLCEIIESKNNILKQLSLAKTIVEAEISLWMISPTPQQREESRKIFELSEIIEVEWNEEYLPEDYLNILSQLYHEKKPKLIVFDSSLASGEIAPRLGFRLGGSSVTSALKIGRNERKLTVEKACYGQNMMASLDLENQINTITLAKDYENKAEISDKATSLKIEKIDFSGSKTVDWALERIREISPQVNGLEIAKKVIIGGRGMGSKAKFSQMEVIAKGLGAKAGATRPAVLNGWAEFGEMIGQSGSILEAEKVIVFGASGSAAFAIGIKGCKMIVAVNSDPNANIFKYADIGIVGDVGQIMEEIEKLLTH